ncbi:hypothetical protein KUCAC02_033745 [Chaenocephalus aceratus]|nr:hypothetical protein KUCAC02_033745 [Chaenocephalus aceratus]
MTKTGKPDGCWAGIMHQYAQGKHRFSTGQRPKSKKWKSVIQRIDACPLTPTFNLPVRYIDIFGRRILCKCGYHVSGDQAGSQNLEAACSSSSGTQHSVPATQSSSGASCPPAVPATQSSSGASCPPAVPATQSSSGASCPPAVPATQSSSGASCPPAVPATQSSSSTHINCSLCSMDICAENFFEHLADFHAEQCCEQCGQKTRGAMELLKHIEDCHLSSTSRSEIQQPTQRTSAPPTQHTSAPPTQHTSAPPTQHTSAPPTQHTSAPPTQSTSAPPTQHTSAPPTQRTSAPPTQHTSAPPTQHTSAPTQRTSAPTQPTPIPQQPQPPPSPLYHTSPSLVHLRPPEVNFVRFLPNQFKRVIKPADQEWIATCLYEPTGPLRQQFSQNWFHPPNPPKLLLHLNP